MQQKPDDLVILDARNAFEAEIGKFTDALIPNIQHFREFPDYIENNLDQFKNKQVLMYCTGGIRCERATTLLKSKNIAKEVYQIEGGIHRYAEEFPDGFFRGKNYVFDGRIAMKINDDILSNCISCKQPFDEYTICVNAKCNNHFIACKTCLLKLSNTCSNECLELIKNQKVIVRTTPAKTADDVCSNTNQCA